MTVPRRLRADAQRSRDRVISAATEVFLRDGVDGSLEEIARQAGVGSATLHRHFPSRWELLDAVFADTVRALCVRAAADSAARDPAAALTSWLHDVGEYFSEVRGLAAAVLHHRGNTSCEACHRLLVQNGGPLLARAIASGAVRQDVTIEELLSLVGGVALATEHNPSGGHRLRVLALEGIRPQ
ncbi:TetR/AcrR family transcriptional regulator [Mycolicibacterium mageritense]|uniref:TetR/AcrR family transcriptional regulator n=1 Tax=Mycolicibacterium mageritense TaxID=53462 RepID=UPI000569FF96|nr:TetR/AcrR family transcriptional regulator [Mycolicibacterium mageritense]MCC9184280.1 TetR/AcrR family transcriptional regulator [Mycolicibacterium mageritense]